MNVVTLQLLVAVFACFAGGCAVGSHAKSEEIPVAGLSLLLVGVMLLVTVLFPGPLQGLLGGTH